MGSVKVKTKINDNSSLGFTYLNYKNELIYTGEKPVILSTSNGDTSYQPITLPDNLQKGIMLIKRKSDTELYVLNEDGIFLLNEKNNSAKLVTNNITFLRNHDWKWINQSRS